MKQLENIGPSESKVYVERKLRAYEFSSFRSIRFYTDYNSVETWYNALEEFPTWLDFLSPEKSRDSRLDL